MMRCDRCGEFLRTTHTYRSWRQGNEALVTSSKCPGCLARYTVISFKEISTGERNTGARAISKKIEDGELRPGLQDGG